MVNPSHPNPNHSLIWRLANINDGLREQEVEISTSPHTNGGSSSRIPIEKNSNQIHKPHIKNAPTKWEQQSELDEGTKNAIAADLKHRYEEALRQMDLKNALNRKQSEATLASFPPSSSLVISVFSYRFSVEFPTLGLQKAGLLGHPLLRNLATVIILLALAWIAMFLSGLFELGNYPWSRPVHIVENIDGDEEQDVELSELEMPSSVVAVPVEKAMTIIPAVTEFES